MESITPYTSFCAGGFLYPPPIAQVSFYRHSNIGIVFWGPEGKDVFARSSPCGYSLIGISTLTVQNEDKKE